MINVMWVVVAREDDGSITELLATEDRQEANRVAAGHPSAVVLKLGGWQ